MRDLVLVLVALSPVHAQWTMQQSHTNASLRGIHNAGTGVVWASGTQGTVLHTTNDGETWQTCVVPQGAEKLDFRGVQAFDANTAIVMSSGTGGLSRLYKTRDACRSWRLVFRNPDASGFWDALQFNSSGFGVLIGDPVRGQFRVFFTTDAGDSWQRFDPKAFSSIIGKQSFFAASNTSILMDARVARVYMITGGGTTSAHHNRSAFQGRGQSARIVCVFPTRLWTWRVARRLGDSPWPLELTDLIWLWWPSAVTTRRRSRCLERLRLGSMIIEMMGHGLVPTRGRTVTEALWPITPPPRLGLQ